MSSSDLKKEQGNVPIAEDWVDISDVVASNPYTDPTVAITGGEASITDQILVCELCQVRFSGVEPYRLHMTGNKHQKKLKKEFMKQKYGAKYLEMVKSKEGVNDMHTEVTDPKNEDDDVVLKYCNVCKKICTGELTYELHMKGKKHKKKVHKMNLMRKLGENPDVDLGEKGKEMEDCIYDPIAQVKPFAQCAICNKKFSGPEGFRDHLSSTSHKKKLGIHELSKNLTAEENSRDFLKDESTGQDTESFGSGDFVLHCSACEKNFTGPVPYQQHLISDAHKKKLKKIELTRKINSLSVKADEADAFECKECCRTFRIPEEFDQHLKSSAHAKKRIKQELVQKLHNEYPEMDVQHVTSNEMDSSENVIHASDNSFILICNVCHKSFSGPETARAHFTSPKHSKAKKQQFILAQQKKMANKNELF